jgi:hypothetical protein
MRILFGLAHYFGLRRMISRVIAITRLVNSRLDGWAACRRLPVYLPLEIFDVMGLACHKTKQAVHGIAQRRKFCGTAQVLLESLTNGASLSVSLKPFSFGRYPLPKSKHCFCPSFYIAHPFPSLAPVYAGHNSSPSNAKGKLWN